jgi:hypothetical protein
MADHDRDTWKGTLLLVDDPAAEIGRALLR